MLKELKLLWEYCKVYWRVKYHVIKAKNAYVSSVKLCTELVKLDIYDTKTLAMIANTVEDNQYIRNIEDKEIMMIANESKILRDHLIFESDKLSRSIDHWLLLENKI